MQWGVRKISRSVLTASAKPAQLDLGRDNEEKELGGQTPRNAQPEHDAKSQRRFRIRYDREPGRVASLPVNPQDRPPQQRPLVRLITKGDRPPRSYSSESSSILRPGDSHQRHGSWSRAGTRDLRPENAIERALQNDTGNSSHPRDYSSPNRETNVHGWKHVSLARLRPGTYDQSPLEFQQRWGARPKPSNRSVLTPQEQDYWGSGDVLPRAPTRATLPGGEAQSDEVTASDVSSRRHRHESTERERVVAHRQRRFAGRRRLYEVQDEDMDDAKLERLERHKQRKRNRERGLGKAATIPVNLPDFISVGNLAGALKVRLEDFAGKLRDLGFEEVSTDHIIDAETAGLVASEFGFEPILPQKASGEDLVAQPEPEDKTYVLNRPPVVTIMGHVDHGKTTLLDWLRQSSVAASEHGGITQHIGAFMVPMQSGRLITFLDTPGHAAFLAMRARGANVTDIVILVVAADDSVKPQTVEAIKHAKEAQVPVIVAISKIDKPEADAQRVKQDLARHGIEVEDFGGDVQTVQVSGKTGEGMADLEEAALALADILDVRAPVDGPVEGWVLESSSGKAGRSATVLVRRGTLTSGTILVAGTTWTRVRTLRNERGDLLESATPGTPVVVDGWREQPGAGDEALQADSEQRAKEAIAVREARADSARMASDVTAANQSRSANAAIEAAAKEAERKGEVEEASEYVSAQRAREQSSGVPEVPLVLRADVAGSAEALDAYIHSISSPLIRPNVLRAQVGQVTSSDVALASDTGGAVVVFNIDVPASMVMAAEKAGVRLLAGSVIYRLVDEVKALMEDRLPDLVTARVLGEATVLEVFEIGIGGRKKLKVAGVRIGNGIMKRGGRVRVIRGGKADDGLTSDLGAGRKGARKVVDGAEPEEQADQGGRVVYDGSLGSLKSHKKDVNEMRKGSDCGLSFDGGFSDFQLGDRVQHYEEIRERRKL